MPPKKSKKPEQQIREYYDTAISDKGIIVNENEDIPTLLEKVQKEGQYLFCDDFSSYWGFVRTTSNDIPCVRMIFAIKEGKGGKVHNIEKITNLIRCIESVLVFVDNIDISKDEGFMYLDVVKNIVVKGDL